MPDGGAEYPHVAPVVIDRVEQTGDPSYRLAGTDDPSAPIYHRLVVPRRKPDRTDGNRTGDRGLLEPPDTDLLKWGGVMGLIEVTAYERVEEALRDAVAAGALRSGRAGCARCCIG